MNQMHTSVLAKEVIEFLAPKKGDTVLDVTLGVGGHSLLFANIIGKTGTLITFDADSENIQIAKQTLSNVDCTLQIHHTNFGNAPIDSLPKFDIIFADLGLSSLHLDIPERGFSFRFNAPLDLRFDRSLGKTAAEWINTASEQEIVAILWQLGEIHKPYKLAKELKSKKIVTTFDVKTAIDEVYTFKAKDYYAQVFQALRMHINNELGVLETLLSYAHFLKPGGRMGIITFHSLEDRLVKHVFKKYCTSTKNDFTGSSNNDALFEQITKKPIIPSVNEIEHNPRARSAKMRIIAKT